MADNLSSVLQRFRTAATNFIEAVDSAPNLERDVFLAIVSRCLAELYSSALYLPVVEPDTAATAETFSINEKSAAELFRSLKEKIGPLDTYWGTFDSTAKEGPTQGSLAADLSEIYSDLKHDLNLDEKSVSPGDLLWELRFSFRSHWGKHLIAALAAIHDRHIE